MPDTVAGHEHHQPMTPRCRKFALRVSSLPPVLVATAGLRSLPLAPAAARNSSPQLPATPRCVPRTAHCSFLQLPTRRYGEHGHGVEGGQVGKGGVGSGGVVLVWGVRGVATTRATRTGQFECKVCRIFRIRGRSVACRTGRRAGKVSLTAQSKVCVIV